MNNNNNRKNLQSKWLCNYFTYSLSMYVCTCTICTYVQVHTCTLHVMYEYIHTYVAIMPPPSKDSAPSSQPLPPHTPGKPGKKSLKIKVKDNTVSIVDGGETATMKKSGGSSMYCICTSMIQGAARSSLFFLFFF